jgi:nitrogen fixation protein FixH
MDEAVMHNARQAESRHRLFWVGLIVALLSAQALLMFAVVYLIVADRSFAVEPDYYQQSMDWDARMAQQRRNEQLGWQVELSVADEANIFGDRKFLCRLTDRQGSPLDGAIIDLVAFPHARGSDRILRHVDFVDDGRYETTLRITRRGKWEFRLVAEHQGETFTHTQLCDVQPPGVAP